VLGEVEAAAAHRLQERPAKTLRFKAQTMMLQCQGSVLWMSATWTTRMPTSSSSPSAHPRGDCPSSTGVRCFLDPVPMTGSMLMDTRDIYKNFSY